MITRMDHVCVYVLDQESAYKFYVGKLGFRVHTDAPMGPGFCWLSVCPPGQPDLQISLMEIKDGMMVKKRIGPADERSGPQGDVRIRRV